MKKTVVLISKEHTHSFQEYERYVKNAILNVTLRFVSSETVMFVKLVISDTCEVVILVSIASMYFC